MVFLFFKIVVVILFLIAFLRRPTLVWGIGLLSVTTAVLLDTLLGTFGREEMVARIGFFFYVFSGFVFSGAALWLWGLLRPTIDAKTAVTTSMQPATTKPAATPATTGPIRPKAASNNKDAAIDYAMLFQEIKERFSHEEVLSLMFDLNITENEVMPINQEFSKLIANIIDSAAERGQGAALALAVERILTPPPAENLPRLEKITADSPPTILRQYVLAHYNTQQLQAAANHLGINWEDLSGRNRPAKGRELILHLKRRNRLDELIDWLHQSA